jgi:hypothetical protein
MKKLAKLTLSVCAVLLTAAFTSHAETKPKPTPKKPDHHSSNATAIPGKVAVVVIGSAGKAAWATTKFVAKDLAAPVAKAVFVKAAPKITVYALKQSPKLAAHALPIALKLALF